MPLQAVTCTLASMEGVVKPGGSLRDRARLAMRGEIAAVAIKLFAKHGFDSVTTTQIAAEAGISPRSFFRYFPTKEDVVLGSLVDSGMRVEEALAARPTEESAWEALGQAMHVLVDRPVYPPEDLPAIARIILDTPSIRARDLEKYQRWEELLVAGVAARLTATEDAAQVGTEDRARAMIGAASACLRVSTDRWLRSGGTEDPAIIFDELLKSIRS